jgi:peptide/nickel transport system substrate-binding protein
MKVPGSFSRPARFRSQTYATPLHAGGEKMMTSTSRKVIGWIIAIGVIALLLAGCAQPAAPVPATQPPAAPTQPPAAPTQPPAAPTQPPAAPTQPPPAPTQAAAKPKVVTFSFVQEADNLNPMYTTMWFSWLMRGFWLTPMVMFDDKAQPVPEIAKEIPSIENGGVSQDGMTITYTLRKEAVWSDGTPLTADDFVFTYQMIMSDKNKVLTRAPYDKYVESVEATAPDKLVIHMKKPFAGWLSGMFNYVLPKHVLEPVFQKDGTLDNAEWNRNPTVGHGPFVFKDWVSGSHMVFEANPTYWRGRPKLDQIYVRFVPDDASQLAALKTGDVDFGVWFAYSDVPDLEKTGNIRIQMAQSGYSEVWYLNVNPKTASPGFLDEKVRMAVLMAVDRENICKELLYGLTKPLNSWWDGSPYGDDPALKPIPYDPEGAKALLDEAGWKVGSDGIREKDGQKLVLRFVTTTREVRMNVQVIVQQELADLGIKVELVNYPGDVFFNGYADQGPIATGQYDIAEWSSNPYGWPDPDTEVFRCDQIPTDENPSGTNWQGLCDKELDNLFEEQATTLDTAKRAELFHQIAKILRDKAYFVSMWNDPDMWAVNKRVVNTKFSGAVPFFYNIMEWDIAE